MGMYLFEECSTAEWVCDVKSETIQFVEALFFSKMAITVTILPYLTLFSLTILPILSYELDSCPLWYQRDGVTGECVCGSSLNGVIRCHPHNHTVSIRICYCMTMDELMLKPVVASCLYTCDYLKKVFTSHTITNLVETNSTSDIENWTCGRYNRRGVLCSKCMEGYGLPVYSYNISCVPCKDYCGGICAAWTALLTW